MRKQFTLLLLGLANILFAQMPNTLSANEKIYGLSKFWQEVNYNFVYLDKVDREQWDSMYQQLLTDVQDTENDYEYYRLLQQFCATLKDGHTNIYFPKAIQDSLYNTYFGEYRLFLTNIDGKAIITRVNQSKKEEIPIGTEVVKVNGQPTETYLQEQVLPYISSSTDYILRDLAISRLFEAPKGTSFDVELKLPDGTTTSLQLTHTETSEQEVYPPFEEQELLEFQWLEDGIAYVALNSFGNSRINTLFFEQLSELYKAEKLIIDLRNNGGGNTDIGRKIIQYLTEDDLLYGSKMQSRLHIPSFKAWGKWTSAQDTVGNAWATQSYLSFRDAYYHDFPYEPDTVKLASERIVVPTALLIGHGTASAAEDFLIYADNQAHMTKIGEPTFGSTGQPMLFDLPGGGSARVCTKKDTYPDGREFVGYGVQPDIVVKKTLEDYLSSHDPVLERAIQFLQKAK